MMSAIYFHAAMALVNVHEQSMGMGFSTTRGLGRCHMLHWTRRTQIMSFCEKKLSMKLGQR